MHRLKEKQYEVYSHNDGDMLVSASAGSGKTFVMISRIIRLVSEGKADVDEILALTFTDAAAKEMKSKLKKTFSDAVIQDEENSLRLSEQLDQTDVADIGTFHGFCAKLIRLYFFKAGVSCDFTIGAEGFIERLKARAMDITMKELYESGSQRMLMLADRYSYKRKDEKLRELIFKAHEFCEIEPEPEEVFKKSIANYLPQAFEQRMADLQKTCDELITESAERMQKLVEDIKDIASPSRYAFAAATNEFVLSLRGKNVFDLAKIQPLSVRSGSGTMKEAVARTVFEITKIKNRVNSFIEKLNKTLAPSLEEEKKKNSALFENTEIFCEAVKNYSRNFAEIKREENVLDFADLEHFALKILKDPEANEKIKNKYKYIFVDEYQDINDVQNEILDLLWRNNTFAVGDLKQSIYGFRGSSPEVFIKKQNELTERKSGYVELNYNFRSAPAVVDAVNEIFSFCMTEETFGLDYKNHAALEYGGLYDGSDGGRAELHLLSKPTVEKKEKEKPSLYDVLKNSCNLEEDEIQNVAALVVKIIHDELGKKRFDVADKKEKPITYGDIAILTRNKENSYVKKIVDGLARYGVPAVAETGEDVTCVKEVKVLVEALKLISRVDDDVALATVMKSPVGGFSDEDLAHIVEFYDERIASIREGNKNKKTFFEAYSLSRNDSQSPMHEKVKNFGEYIDSLRFYADFNSAKEVMEKITSDSSYIPFLLASVGGETKVKRVRRFIRAAGENGDVTVDEFLERVKSAPIKMGSPAEENSVKVVTMHASKGLEYPVVIVCGTERLFNKQSDYEEVLFDREYGFITKYYDDENRRKYETILRSSVCEKFDKERKKEEMRLFYVALTRAKYSLHVVYEGNKDPRTDDPTSFDRFISFIPKTISFKQTEESPKSVDTLVAESEPRTVIFSHCDRAEREKMRENFEFSYPREIETRLPIKSSVTAALKTQDEREEHTPVLFEEYSRGESKENGIAAHAIMEAFDFSRKDRFEEQINAMIKNGVVEEEAVKKLDLEKIKKVISSKIFDGIEGKRVYREKRFIFNAPASVVYGAKSEEPVLIQGIIDLLVVDDDGAEIIDYKYSFKTAEKLKETYAKQLNLYAMAVETALLVKVKRKSIISLLTGETAVIL